ncbi:MAG: hypothetical protein A3E21_05820 [Sulfurimonas sp. RIFCSPHIGHO2_12_FULL_36_9]|nr:MAG: hypothetical protein A3E21_05820 [Sulfurimonas sp. RIFCSPHIGHO2_12_FULL_36_9]OHD97823.1 MAG: hypothetical protein A3J26_02230 [Sulfurimonas sp. RIFCSPLOWO2_02_FULL_36_28]OHE01529.1 MAG: hypothetical protein A3K14_10175 [Sulfurimonas sp. RIFCSPLOWO2_12_FULL_36_74]
MQISSNMGVLSSAKSVLPVKTLFSEKISKDEALEIKEQIKQNANAIAFNSASIQGAVSGKDGNFKLQYEEFQNFLKGIGYNGKPIADLSKEEASALVSEDGFFGVKQTSERIANFVINGAGTDEDRFRAGREGMIQGFKEAEEMWGGELPEISQQTMAKAIEMVDKAMYDLGFSILDEEV